MQAICAKSILPAFRPARPAHDGRTPAPNSGIAQQTRAVAATLRNGLWYRARAPLRISLGGGGTDLYPYVNRYGGAVISSTIDRYIYATLKTEKDEVVFESMDRQQSERLPLQASYPTEDALLPLHRAIYNRIVQDYNSGKPMPLRLCTFSDVPGGTGLGSSSTLTVAALRCFDEMLGLGLSAFDLADLAHRVERQDLGLLGGYQDQYASAFGGFNLMEFRTDDTVMVNPLRLDRRILAELEFSTLLYFTGVSREGASIIQEQSASMESNQQTIEKMHKIKELAQQMKQQLMTGQIEALGKTLHESWLVKRDTASGISTPGIDQLYQKARDAGAWGGKISGAGGGGFILLLCDPLDRPAVLNCLPNGDTQDLFCHFTSEGAHAWRP